MPQNSKYILLKQLCIFQIRGKEVFEVILSVKLNKDSPRTPTEVKSLIKEFGRTFLHDRLLPRRLKDPVKKVLRDENIMGMFQSSTLSILLLRLVPIIYTRARTIQRNQEMKNDNQLLSSLVLLFRMDLKIQSGNEGWVILSGGELAAISSKMRSKLGTLSCAWLMNSRRE